MTPDPSWIMNSLDHCGGASFKEMMVSTLPVRPAA